VKPEWLRWKELHTAEVRAEALLRQRLFARIKDLCWDIDVWRDESPGSALDQARERLGVTPSLAALQREHARLLRQAALRGVADREEVAA